MKCKQNRTHIRVKPDDAQKWKNYSRLLGEPSADLFSKVLNSKALELDKRVYEEYRKKIWSKRL